MTAVQKRDLAFKFIMQQFPGWTKEHRFHEKRKWRFDFAWPEKKIALEYEGGIFTHGGHVRGAHYDSDCEKYNTASILGWIVIRLTPIMLRDSRAIEMVKQAHQARSNYVNASKHKQGRRRRYYKPPPLWPPA